MKSKENHQETKPSSLKQSAILYVIVSLALVLSVVFLQITVSRGSSLNRQMLEMTRLSNDLAQTIAYLSMEASFYVQDWQQKHLAHYWKNLRIEKTRERIIQGLKEQNPTAVEFDLIEEVKRSSDALVDMELRTMRLVSEAAGIDASTMHPGLARLDLELKERALSGEQKLNLGKSLIFGDVYDLEMENVKEKIRQFQRLATERLDREIGRTRASFSMVLTMLVFLSIFIPVILVVNIRRRKKVREILMRKTRIAVLGADLGVALTHAETLEGMLRQVAEAMVTHLDGSLVHLWILNENGNIFELRASVGEAALAGKGPASSISVNEDLERIEREWAKREDFWGFQARSLVIDDRKVGMLVLFSRGALSEFTQEALSSVADEVAIGIERKLAEARLQEKNEELTQNQNRLLDALSELRQAHIDLQETQAQLIQSEKFALLGKLSGMISHEFRNELGVMRNAAYFLKLKLKDADEKVLKHLGILEERIEDTERIIENIMSFAKNREPNFAEIDIGMLLYASIGKVKVPDHIQVYTQIDSEMPKIPCDQVQLSRAFINIIMNAVQAIGDQRGGIMVRAQQEGDQIWIKFEDNGPGIRSENKQRVFEPLFTTKARGAGLGLATAQLLVEGHGGKIEMESEWGKGSTVHIRLPLYRGQSMEQKKAA